MPYKPIHPALAAARIWSVVVLLGPMFLLLADRLYRLRPGSLPMLRPYQEPDYFELYSALLIAGVLLALLPFFITWALLASWNKKRLPVRMMAERLLLLCILFTVAGLVFFMTRVGTQHPLTTTAMVLAPYMLAGILGIVWALGWPYRKFS